MKGLALFGLLASACSMAHAMVKVVERPMMLYSTVSPKLRIQTEASAFSGTSAAQCSRGRAGIRFLWNTPLHSA